MPPEEFATSASIVIIGAGAAGLCAALAAHEAGVAEVIVLERDSLPRGSTALSSGLIPAAGTRFQRAHGIGDSPSLFAADIRQKAHGEPDATIVERIAQEAGSAIEWLADRHGLPFSLVHNFDYPGHSERRMHGLPSRSGAELIDRLRQAADEAAFPLVLNATVHALYADGRGRIGGVEIIRPDGAVDRLGCQALILACSGYGATPIWSRITFPKCAAQPILVTLATAVMRCDGEERSVQNSSTCRVIRGTARWRIHMGCS